MIGHATVSDNHFQAFVDNAIRVIDQGGNPQSIRGNQYKEARETVAASWAGNTDSFGYISGQEFVDAMADLLEAMYRLAHP